MEHKKRRLLLAIPSLLGLGLLAHHLTPMPRAPDERPRLFEQRGAQARRGLSGMALVARRETAYDPGPALDRMLLTIPDELSGTQRPQPNGRPNQALAALTAPPARSTATLENALPRRHVLTAFPQNGPPRRLEPQPRRLTGFQFGGEEEGPGGGARPPRGGRGLRGMRRGRGRR
ncbi:MAG: hypothetical protein HY077_08570 [Elusimicrobia bacterium]|nr:hypothetical protein [Elusimicrobiota bacterium]